jgi:hypothetical protein
MARSLTNRKQPPALLIPPGQDGESCQIVFGHNTEIQKVLMQFSVSASRLVFSPDEARDVASKLKFYADMADGKQAM